MVVKNDRMRGNMTSKQRSYLKGLAMNIDPVFQIGKSSVTPENVEAISEKVILSTFHVKESMEHLPNIYEKQAIDVHVLLSSLNLEHLYGDCPLP